MEITNIAQATEQTEQTNWRTGKRRDTQFRASDVKDKRDARVGMALSQRELDRFDSLRQHLKLSRAACFTMLVDQYRLEIFGEETEPSDDFLQEQIKHFETNSHFYPGVNSL